MDEKPQVSRLRNGSPRSLREPPKEVISMNQKKNFREKCREKGK